MCAKSFASMLLASVFAAIASVASAASPVTYTVVAHSETNYSVVAPVAALAAPVTPAPTTIYAVAAPAPAPAPVPVTSYAPANVTVAPVTPAPVAAPQEKFAPSNEPLAPTSYLASYRANAFQALMQAVALDSQAGQQPLTADEMNLFRDAADGRAEHWTMAEAALVASGVTDRNQRLGYMAQIDQITEEAKVATANAKTPKAKAKQLIMFLLKGPMKAGYVSGQFNLRVLLDTNEFNCCSSAALFIIVGHRLNMEVAAVQRPGHIFARIPGYDVETTSGALYPSNIRAERILKGLAKNNEDLGDNIHDRPPLPRDGRFRLADLDVLRHGLRSRQCQGLWQRRGQLLEGRLPRQHEPQPRLPPRPLIQQLVQGLHEKPSSRPGCRSRPALQPNLQQPACRQQHVPTAQRRTASIRFPLIAALPKIQSCGRRRLRHVLLWEASPTPMMQCLADGWLGTRVTEPPVFRPADGSQTSPPVSSCKAVNKKARQ